MTFIRSFLAPIAAAVFFAAGSIASAELSATQKELAPTGKLRVGIGVGTVPTAFYATRDEAGRPRGVTVDLANAFARKLGVPLELVIYASSGEITEAAASGAWDVAFIPIDAEREKKLDFGPVYYVYESTYLVPAGSPIKSLEEVDRPGVRVYGIDNTATARGAARSLKNTQVMTARTQEEIEELLRSGKADALAHGREVLMGLAARYPGTRILDGHFLSSRLAVAVPKGRPAALAQASALIEEAKAAGLVRRALDDAGLKHAEVAPPAPPK